MEREKFIPKKNLERQEQKEKIANRFDLMLDRTKQRSAEYLVRETIRAFLNTQKDEQYLKNYIKQSGAKTSEEIEKCEIYLLTPDKDSVEKIYQFLKSDKTIYEIFEKEIARIRLSNYWKNYDYEACIRRLDFNDCFLHIVLAPHSGRTDVGYDKIQPAIEKAQDIAKKYGLAFNVSYDSFLDDISTKPIKIIEENHENT